MFSSFKKSYWLCINYANPISVCYISESFYHVSTALGPLGRHLTIVIFDKIAAM